MKRFFITLSKVLRREMGRIMTHPRQVLWVSAAVAFSYFFFLTLMKDGQPQRLPIAIVDEDATYLSRRLCHEVEATQGVRVAYVFDNHQQAREAMQRQQIYAFLEIPHGTYNEVLSFHAPHIALYANNAYLLSGTLSYKSLMTICNLASGAVQREVLRKKGFTESQIMGMIMPIEIDAHLVGNPMANYQSYLLTTILPGILGLLALLVTIYVMGIEVRQGTAAEWFATANGSTAAAIWGKLLPYGLLFILLQLLGNIVVFGFCHFPLRGSFLTLSACSILFVMAMMAAGVFFLGLMGDLRNAVCIGAFYGILGFSFSGFTYPVSGMSPALQAVSIFFPLRQNYLVYVNEDLFGLPLAASYWHLAILAAFLLLPLTIRHGFKRMVNN